MFPGRERRHLCGALVIDLDAGGEVSEAQPVVDAVRCVDGAYWRRTPLTRQTPLVSEQIDGKALRAQWDAACARGETALRPYVDVARERDEAYLVDYRERALGQLRILHNMVNGHRAWPPQVAAGLIRDMPEDFWHDPYVEVGTTLEAITDLYHGGLGAPGWDWSTGMPPGWPISWRDRMRAYLPASS
jgi:hypothetical protein